MARKTRLKAAPVAQPADDEEAAAWIAEIGKLQRERDLIEAAMNEDVAAITSRAAADARPLGEKISARLAGLQAWASVHRDRLTNGGKRKFWRCAGGELSWRNRPPSVALKKVKKVIERLRALGLTQFLRTKEEVNREAMLADRDAAAAVEGVTIVTDVEDFIVVPLETALEEVAKP